MVDGAIRLGAKVEHDLVALLVVAANGVLVGIDTFVEIELWGERKAGLAAALSIRTSSRLPCGVG
jgi:hypothetical protein